MLLKTAKEIGAYVREQRKLLGWTQQELANKVGVQRLWLVQFEKGKSSAQLGLALRTLKALGISLSASLNKKNPESSRQNKDLIDLAKILDRGNRPND